MFNSVLLPPPPHPMVLGVGLLWVGEVDNSGGVSGCTASGEVAHLAYIPCLIFVKILSSIECDCSA